MLSVSIVSLFYVALSLLYVLMFDNKLDLGRILIIGIMLLRAEVHGGMEINDAYADQE